MTPDDGFKPEHHEWPENEKLANVVVERNAAIQFIEYLGERGYELGTWDEGDFFPAMPSINRLAHEWLGLNENKLEEERRAMLASLRAHA